jgi:hypothetical protein
MINLLVVSMNLVTYINIDESIDSLRKTVLNLFNSNPSVNHIILINDREDTSNEGEKKLSAIAQRLQSDLQYAIDPPPTIGYQYESFISLEDVNTLVMSIDFDGCADTSTGKQHIIQNVVDFVDQYPSVQRIIVLIGSLRQSLDSDYYNATQNAKYHNNLLLSCYQIGTLFIQQLRNTLSTRESNITVEFDPLMMSDILNDLELGATYQSLQSFYKQSVLPKEFIITSLQNASVDLLMTSADPGVQHAFEWMDPSKISTIMVQTNYIVQTYRDSSQNIHFRFYDDRRDILNNLCQALERDCLLVKNMTFDCVESNADGCSMFSSIIVGSAPYLPNYNNFLYNLANQLPTPHYQPDLEQQIISYCESCLYPCPTISEPVKTDNKKSDQTLVINNEKFNDPIETEREAVCAVLKPVPRRLGMFDARSYSQDLFNAAAGSLSPNGFSGK